LAVTVPGKECVSIVKAMKSFMALFGVPEKIICDQGVEFSSNLFKDLCKQHELEHDNRDIEANRIK